VSKKTLSPSTSLSMVPAAHKVQIAKQSNNFLRGKIMLIAHKFLVPPTVYYAAIQRIVSLTYWPEVVIIVAMVNIMPMARWYYLRQQMQQRKKQREAVAEEANADVNKDNNADEHDKEREQILHSFTATNRYKMALVIEQFGTLQSTLYLSDVFLVFLKLLNFDFVVDYQAQRVAGSIIFSTWLARNVSRLKFHYLTNGIPSWSMSAIRRQRRERPNNGAAVNYKYTKPMGVYSRFANKILDVMIYVCACLVVVDLLGMRIGFALKSVFGLGSFGTLVLSLASKDVAAEFVGGLMIQSSNFFDEGECVILQDGTTGVVVKIGWLVSDALLLSKYLLQFMNQTGFLFYCIMECLPTFSTRTF
jgi:small-conductance mechanosensitive channel